MHGKEMGALAGKRACQQSAFLSYVCHAVIQVFMDPNFDQYLPGDDFMSDYLGSLTNTAVIDVSISRHQLSCA